MPLLAGMAFGGRYAFIACTLGLGALYPFVLWPSNGWACVVTCVLLIFWPTANGYMRGVRQRKPAFWNHPQLVYLLTILIFNAVMLTLFPLVMRLNPPPWYPHAELSMPLSILYAIQIKGTIILYVLIMLCDYLLKLPFVRMPLGLAVKKESRYNGRIALVIFLGSLAVWYLFVLFDRALLLQSSSQGYSFIGDQHEAVALIVFLAAGIFIGSMVVKYQESRLKAEDSLVESQGRLGLAVRAARIGIWDWDIKHDVLLWDDSMYSVYGLPKDDFDGAYETWQRVLHPEDREYAEGEIQAAIRGEREYSPEFRILRTDGSVRYIKASSQTIRNRDGEAMRMIGVNIDITEDKKSEENIKRTLREKETLIRELYHRTKNTLQVVRSFILLQAASSPGVPEIEKLAKTIDTRIQAISLVHQMLYQGRDLSQIPIGSYIRNLTEMIFNSYGVSLERITVRYAIEEMQFLLDSAIPLGLILNELLTNSLKYAFPAGRNGVVEISLTSGEAGRILCRYEDDGVGVLPGFDFRNQDSLGLKLIYSLGEQQMMGTVRFANDRGVSCLVDFPKNLYQERV